MAKLIEEIRESSGDFLRGEAQAVYGATISPDGRVLAYGVRGIAREGHRMHQRHFTLKLRDLADHYTPDPDLLPRPTPGGPLTFAPDGAMLASASDRHVDVWTIPDGRHFALRDFPVRVHAVAYSPDGKTLACALTNNPLVALVSGLRGKAITNSVALWDVSGPNPMLATPIVLQGHRAPVTALAFTPDGERLVSASVRGDLHIADVRTHGLVASFSTGRPIRHLTISPDCRWLAVADDLPVLYDLASVLAGQPHHHNLDGHSRAVNSLAFSADSALLASASDDTTIGLWELSSGSGESRARFLGAIKGHGGAVNSISFSPDGRLLASSSLDHTVRLWQLT